MKHLHPELRGLLILALVALLSLSLISFAYVKDSTNWFGLIGHSIGWLCHALFGLGSYPICLFLAWVGWRLLLSKPIEHLAIKVFFISVMVGSLCILLSLVEDAAPSLKNLLGNAFYPALYSQKLRYHLGGAPFFFLYKDLPFFNLHHLLNSIGIAIIFCSTLLASLLFLTGMSLLQLLGGVKRLLTPREKEPSQEEEEKPEEKDDTRYVKLRIPEGPPNINSNINDQPAANQGLLAIKPETNLTSRPSLSRKENAINKSSIEKSVEKALEPKKQPPAESKREAALKAQKVHNGDFTNYALPPLNLLTIAKKVDQSSIKKDLRKQAEVLEETLQSFGIEAKVGQINCGPTINSFEVHPAIGVKVQKIKALENDIALNMEAKSIRIIAQSQAKQPSASRYPTHTARGWL